ncbi:MAG: ABC transporter substrate-binding protein [Myxococcota bacterium]
MPKTLRIGFVFGLLALAAAGCEKKEEAKDEPAEAPAEAAEEKGPDLVGIDMEAKKVTIGALNDESGPAATIGKPYAVGKRMLVDAVNAGDVDALPDGWTIELVEKDHGYNPQKSVQHYDAIKNDVLFIATSFGTPNTLPLVDMLKKDEMVAFPASLSSEMAKNRHTPPLGPSYEVEAMRAMDWAVQDAGEAGKVKAGIVYQQDDYGKDGLSGWKEAADHHDVEIVSEQSIAPGETDVTAAITSLKEKGANYVLLTTLPSTTGPILGTAAQLKYAPKWLGNTPAWIDGFFEPETIPPAVFDDFRWVTGLTYWGEEDVDGMDDFLEVYEKHGKDKAEPDYYILASYAQGIVELEALRRAIDKGPVTRAAYLEALQSIDSFDAGGMFQEVDLSKFPYLTSDQTRVLEPDLDERTWEQVADYASPEAKQE